MLERPYVRVEPGLRCGRPNVAGISCEAIALDVWDGMSVDETAATFNLTRAQVLVACWFEGRHGALRRSWREWVIQAARSMAHDQWDDVPDPPTKEEVDEHAALEVEVRDGR